MDHPVNESAIDYDEVFRRGGQNLGDEDFALFQCPGCGRIYLLESEVDTVYLDPHDLARRVPVDAGSFDCVACGRLVPRDVAWVGPKAAPGFGVTWAELEASDWAWVARRTTPDPARRLTDESSEERMADEEKVKGPASYFPAIEKTYGKPVAHWFQILDGLRDKKHMERVAHLKAEHKIGHGHANALVAYHQAQSRA